jgi:hypothetical protein
MPTDATTAPADREAIREEVRGELRRESRRRGMLGCAGCLMFVVLAVVIPTLLVASVVAKSGVVHVPVFTRWLYRPGAPVRVVTPVAGAQASEIITAELLKARPDRNTGLASVRLNESELSAVAVGFTKQFADRLPLRVTRLQIAIEPEFIEVFAESPRADRDATLTMRLVPTTDGASGLRLDLVQLQLGQWTVPKPIAEALTSLVRRDAIAGLQGLVSGVGQVVDIDLERGEAKVLVRVNGRR